MLKYLKFWRCFHYIIITHEIFEDEMKTKGLIASAAIQNLCLAAWEEGLGTVWIGGYVLHA